MEIALEGIFRFPNKEPALYYNLGYTLTAMGYKEEARRVLKSGIKRFPANEDLKELLRELDEDDPNGGNSAILSILLLAALIKGRFRRKRY